MVEPEGLVPFSIAISIRHIHHSHTCDRIRTCSTTAGRGDDKPLLAEQRECGDECTNDPKGSSQPVCSGAGGLCERGEHGTIGGGSSAVVSTLCLGTRERRVWLSVCVWRGIRRASSVFFRTTVCPSASGSCSLLSSFLSGRLGQRAPPKTGRKPAVRGWLRRLLGCEGGGRQRVPQHSRV